VSLIDELKALIDPSSAPPAQPEPALEIRKAKAEKIPEQWRPHSDIGDDGGVIVTPPVTVTNVPDDQRHVLPESDVAKILRDHGLSPDQWKVVSFRRGTWQRDDGEWRESRRLSVAPVAQGKRFGLELPDLSDIEALIESTPARKRKPPKTVQETTTVLALVADPQVGKVDVLGGISDLLQRDEDSRQRWKAYARLAKPAEIIIADMGDIIENFESAPNADRMNDLSLTEQIRVARRIIWKWIDAASRLAPVVHVVCVGSNHGRVRRGKQNMGDTLDDYGIEINAQLADMAATYPDRYGHVHFWAPERHEETLSHTCVGGKTLGFTHGHQARSQAAIGKWWEGQIAGRKPTAQADILFAGHYHNFRVETVADGRWLFGCPAMENGSSWFSNVSGAQAPAAVLALTVDETGWKDIALL
jgi:hypothetical protein